MAENPEVYYVLCRNITEMLRAEKLLVEQGFSVRAVPAPPKAAGPCSTALEIPSSILETVQALLGQKGFRGIKVISEDHNRSSLLNKLLEVNRSTSFGEALTAILRGGAPSLNNIRILLKASGEEQKKLWEAANAVREDTLGDEVELRAALEFSNYCKQDCLYCGLRLGNSKLTRYRMSENEILAQALKIRETGIQTIILQSGEDPWYSKARMANIIKAIREETGMRITLSLGIREAEEYKFFKQCGASNYLLKVETTDPRLFSDMHPGLSVVERIEHVRLIKKAGYITGSGNIIGLPGQDLESIARDILWFWQEGIHMIGIGPFVPACHSPLEEASAGSVDLTLNAIAVTRLVCRNAYIPSTTALASLDPKAQIQGLACGANTVMLIMTPPEIRDKYAIYQNKMMVDLQWALSMIETLKRKIPRYIKGDGRFE